MAVRVSKADFEEKVLKEKLPVLVDFYSDPCVACKDRKSTRLNSSHIL